MYQIHNAYARKPKSNGLWEEIDLGEMECRTIFSKYTNVFMNVTDDFHPGKIFGVDLSTIMDLFNTYEGNFNQWLESLGNRTIPVTEGEFVLRKEVVEYEDAVKAQFKISPVSHNGHVDLDLPRGAKHDVLLTKKEIGVNADYYKKAASQLLVSIGGYYHFVDYSEHGLHIVDGMRTINHQRANTPNIGLTSFHKVGNLKYIPITREMVYKQDIRDDLYHKAYIKLNEDISSETFMIVIGGYLHVMDDRVARLAGDNIIAVDFKYIPLHERLYESMKDLDFNHYLQPETGATELHLDGEHIISDEFLTRYLTMSQSFIIVLDHGELFIEKHQIQHTRIHGQFLSDVYPNLPLVVGHGRAAEYWAVLGNNRWAINVYDSLTDNYVLDSMDTQKGIAYIGNRYPLRRTDYSRGQLWEIGRYSLKVLPH